MKVSRMPLRKLQAEIERVVFIKQSFYLRFGEHEARTPPWVQYEGVFQRNVFSRIKDFLLHYNRAALERWSGWVAFQREINKKKDLKVGLAVAISKSQGGHH